MTIEVRENYETWVSKQMVPLFEKSGISITQNARNLLAYAMQSQIEEKLVKSDEDLFNRCERFCDFAVKMYSKKHGSSEMNVNRAMHLIRDLTCT